MNITIDKSTARGIITAPPSKSMAHRDLICDWSLLRLLLCDLQHGFFLSNHTFLLAARHKRNEHQHKASYQFHFHSIQSFRFRTVTKNLPLPQVLAPCFCFITGERCKFAAPKAELSSGRSAKPRLSLLHKGLRHLSYSSSASQFPNNTHNPDSLQDAETSNIPHPSLPMQPMCLR